MKRVGIAYLPLHYGRAPPWLISGMKRLAHGIVSVMIDEFGLDEFLRRISSPWWFQSLGCCLGYDWHSSGLTTVTTSVLKTVLRPEEHGIAVAGGKGKVSLRVPAEIEELGKKLDLSADDVNTLKYSSRMAAKVDNSAIQVGYPLYHHAFFITEEGKWAVIQQGMNIRDKTARRYHWLSEHVEDFVVEPHDAIICDVRRDVALNMTDKTSEGCRRASVDIVREGPKKVLRMLKSIRPSYQRSLDEWVSAKTKDKTYVTDTLYLPRNLNWEAIKEAYELQPRNYEKLLSIQGIGPAAVRALALISELIYGEKPSWRDPVKYSFAFGGKDGVPFPVNKKAMDEVIRIFEAGIEKSGAREREKTKTLQRLRLCFPPT